MESVAGAAVQSCFDPMLQLHELANCLTSAPMQVGALDGDAAKAQGSSFEVQQSSSITNEEVDKTFALDEKV